MKKIQLLSVPVTNSQAAKDFELDYRFEFLRLVEVVPEGITISEMGDAIKIADKLRIAQTGSTVYLEDAEHAYLLNRVKNFRFQLVCREIYDMLESLKNAVTEDAPHLKSRAESATP